MDILDILDSLDILDIQGLVDPLPQHLGQPSANVPDGKNPKAKPGGGRRAGTFKSLSDSYTAWLLISVLLSFNGFYVFI